MILAYNPLSTDLEVYDTSESTFLVLDPSTGAALTTRTDQTNISTFEALAYTSQGTAYVLTSSGVEYTASHPGYNNDVLTETGTLTTVSSAFVINSIGEGYVLDDYQLDYVQLSPTPSWKSPGRHPVRRP